MPDAVAPAADPSTSGSPPASITPDQAADKLEALLGKGSARQAKPDDEEPSTSSGQAEPEASPEPEATSPDQSQPAAETDPEAPEGEQPDETPEADEDNVAIEGQDFLFTVNGQEFRVPWADVKVPVKLDGKDVPMPLGEVANGYMRHSDYTRAKQAVSQEKQAFAEYVQQVQQERQVYSVMIGALEEQLKQAMPQEPNWAELEAHPDKSHYWAARARWDEIQRRLGAAAEEQDRLQQLQAMDVTTKLNEHLTHARAWLVEQLPAWRDEKRAAADKSKLRDYALKAGFTQHDVDHAYDPRLIILGHKARLYDELVANRPRPQIEQGEAPSPLKPGVAMHQGATKSAQLSKAKRRLAQTGRPEDAEAAIMLKLMR